MTNNQRVKTKDQRPKTEDLSLSAGFRRISSGETSLVKQTNIVKRKLNLELQAMGNEHLPSRIENQAKWFVLYTRSRHEKFVESQLIRKGIESFTPKVTLKKRWSDRIKLIEEPLFKSYCFAKFSLNSKIPVVSQTGVVNIVHFNNQYVPVDESVINSLKILVKNRVKLDPYPYLKEGDKVEIKRGPLKGLEGYIVEKRNKNMQLVISVDAIASSIKCIIDADCVDSA